jgi:NAD(P)H dehydrogenase (quinone)
MMEPPLLEWGLFDNCARYSSLSSSAPISGDTRYDGEFMMGKIAISGASGDLGRRVSEILLGKMNPRDLTLVTRHPDNRTDATKRGVKVVPGDYRNPESLEKAYAGSDVLMVISGHAVAKRIPEHRNAIAAARKVGIKHIVYTSVAGIHPRNPTISAGDHIVTERDLYESGLGFTSLRNQTYSELFTPMAQSALESGTWLQVGDKGLIAPVSKDDIALCAATCLLEPEKHSRVIYEITGPELLSFRDIADRFSRLYNVPIGYKVITTEQMYEAFEAWGIPRGYNEDSNHPAASYGSDEIVTAYIAFDQGYHAILSHHVEFITGKKPVALSEVMAKAKAAA